MEVYVNMADSLGTDVTLQAYRRTEPPDEAFYVVKEA
jgi:hypothetical protein